MEITSLHQFNAYERDAALPIHMIQEIREIPIAEIDLEDRTYQCRLDMKVDDLMLSLKRDGQKVPVILRGANPPYRIVCGFRRISSLKMLGVRAVNAITGNFSHEEALTLAILENEMRKSFCDLDRAFGIRKLLESGKDLNDVSHIFKIKRRRIFQLKSLVNFPKNILNALAEKRISTHHALILKRAAEKFPEISFAEWIEKIQRENMPVRKLGDAIRKTLEERKRFPKIINREPDELFNEDELTGGESHLLKFNFRSIDLKKLSKREQESYSASLRRLAQIIENFSEPGADFRFLPVSGRNGVHPGALRKNGTK